MTDLQQFQLGAPRLRSNGNYDIFEIIQQMQRQIRSLLNNSLVDAGTVSITPSAANTPTSVTVTFNSVFTNPPVIQATAYTSVPGTQVTGVGVGTVTTTTAVIYLTRTNTTTTSVAWLAYDPT